MADIDATVDPAATPDTVQAVASAECDPEGKRSEGNNGTSASVAGDPVANTAQATAKERAAEQHAAKTSQGMDITEECNGGLVSELFDAEPAVQTPEGQGTRATSPSLMDIIAMTSLSEKNKRQKVIRVLS